MERVGREQAWISPGVQLITVAQLLEVWINFDDVGIWSFTSKGVWDGEIGDVPDALI